VKAKAVLKTQTHRHTRVLKLKSNRAWQVLKVALLFPILGKVLPRDLSPLRSILVEMAWERMRNRSAPLELEGASRLGIF
jgi:hypothetical protein